MAEQKGSVLIGMLMVSLLLLLAGLGFLGQRIHQYSAAASVIEGTKALGYAEAGVEDVRLKLLKDQEFPPWNPTQNQFAYSEDYYDGGYTITCQRLPEEGPPSPNDTLELPGLLVINIEGFSGPRASPLARRRLRLEYRESDRQMLVYQDRGGL